MAVACRSVFPAAADSVPSFIIVRPSRPRIHAGMIDQGGVPGDGIPDRWPRRLRVFLGGGSGWTRLQSNDYWSGTEYAPNPSNAWNFNTNNGNQNNDDKNNALYAVAVRPGG
jgi:hypothetical protein